MRKIANILTLALLALLLVAATVFAFEGLIRVMFPWWAETSAERLFDVDGEGIDGYGRVATGRPAWSGYFAQNDGDFRTAVRLNDLGHRHDGQARDAEGRVWVFGDSYTFGWGVEADETYAAVASQLAGVPSYNLGVGGLNVCGYQAHAQRLLRTGVKPSAVVVGISVETDIADLACASLRTRGEPPSDMGLVKIKQWLLDSSAIYALATIAIKSTPSLRRAFVHLGLIAGTDRDEPREMEDLGKAVDRTLIELGTHRTMFPGDTPFAILVIVCRFEITDPQGACGRLRSEFVAGAARAGFQVIDPSAEVLALGTLGMTFEHDGHWTPEAHRVAGVALARWLRIPGR